ncbi:MAG: DUF4335 domain-containing protein [Leptolyngbya sp. DLM2.Bin27]|nr:MAG: DUF4335 domain-containing protein [Leptolyngbya sp. DLM2.Bin27]
MAQTATITSYEYTAGTCTLRLVGELSPLSQVTGRPVLVRSRFHLQLYSTSPSEPAQSAASPAIVFEIKGREPQFSALANLVQTYVQRCLGTDGLATAGEVSQGENSLQPVGLTRHRLTLADPPAAPQPVELSTLQLSDLADALEQADSQIQIMPEAALPEVRRSRPRLPLWLGSVAAVGIAALLGNQIFVTAPRPAVISPGETESLAEPLDGASPQTAEDSLSQDRQQFTLDETPPAAETTPDPAAPDSMATGEALPQPATTALTTPAASQPPQPPPITTPQPAPAAPPPGGSRERLGARSSPPPGTAADQAPASPNALRAPSAAPDTPEALDAEPGMAATSAADPEAAWVATLTQALQRRWRPPADLVAPLRYRLTLTPEGTVATLEPLDRASAIYQTLSTLPQPDTNLPGLARADEITVEVKFLPDGEVVVSPLGASTP